MKRLVPFAAAGLVLLAAAAAALLHTTGAAMAVAAFCAVIAGAITRPRPAEPMPPPLAPDELETLREALREAERRETALQEDRRAALSRLRHDVRGALSPMLLIADRLLMAEEADKRRAGDVISRAVNRAAELLRNE